MGDWNLSSGADRAWQLLEDVPTTISGAVMTTIADQSRIFIQNYCRVSIGSNAISEKYQNAVTNLTAGKTLMRMLGIGADFDFSLGQFNVSRASSARPEAQQAQMLLNQAAEELKVLRQQVLILKANG